MTARRAAGQTRGMDVGFIGLGGMGLPMANNLVAAGHAVTVYNRTRSKAERVKGAAVADTPGGACGGGVVLSILADDQAVRDVTFGAGGILEALKPGGIHASMSTISVALSRELAEAHAAAGQVCVAAPVFGRPDAAEAAKLRVLAAGPADAIETCRPLFEAVGQTVFALGEVHERANAVKLGGNFLLAAMLEALGEAFALVQKHGVEPARFLEIANSVFNSPVYAGYGGQVAEQRFDPVLFPLKLALKDLRLVLAAADGAAVPMPLASLAHDHLLQAVAQGKGELDWSALGRVSMENAGL